jgi:hypothetical protein
MNNIALEKYAVTFETGDGGSAVEGQTVQNGRHVLKPDNPSNEGGDAFVSWQSAGKAWNFSMDIVTSDLILTARWRPFSADPVEVAMNPDEPFTSSLVWYQGSLENAVITVGLKSASSQGAYEEISGTIDIADDGADMHLVTFTPDTVPQGGLYNAKIKTVRGEAVTETEVRESDALTALLFKGAGSAGNPYLVAANADLRAVISDPRFTQGYFKQTANLENLPITDPIVISSAEKQTFAGTYDGDGKTIKFEGDGGVFHKIAAAGTVKNLILEGTVTASLNNAWAVGGLTDENSGTIDGVKSRIGLTDNKLTGALVADAALPDRTATSTGGGAVAGVNKAGAIIRNCQSSGSGTVKTVRVGGGIVAYNFGTVERCSTGATMPAGNQANSGNSSAAYSLVGGIAGVNWGIVRQSSVTGRVFAQSAYAAAGDGNEGKNMGFGGIVAYNKGTIEECSFSRVTTANEFVPKSQGTANNLGVASVHGDIYAGGIAGINDGTIKYSYVSGAIIGARDYAGGIAGKTLSGSVISNSYVLAEVEIKDVNGVIVSAPNAKTTATRYDIAPAGGGVIAGSIIYKPLETSTGAEWHSGNLTTPIIPSLTPDDIILLNGGENKFGVGGGLLWQTGGVTGVSLNVGTLGIGVGQNGVLTATVAPDDAADQSVVWNTNNPGVATVSQNGTVTGVTEGMATITVTTRDGGFTASCTVTVTAQQNIPVTGLTVTADGITLPEAGNSVRQQIAVGTVFTFIVVVEPNDATDQSYTITPSNGRAAVVGNQVTIMIGGAGAGNLTITVALGGISKAYNFVTVTA